MSADDCRRLLYQFLTTNTWGATLPFITHIIFSQAGPLSYKLLKDLKARLEDVEDDFDDTWVASIITASFAKPSPDTIVPSLPNGESSGLESRGAETMGPGSHSKFCHFRAQKPYPCMHFPLSSYALAIVLIPALCFYRQTSSQCCNPSQIRS